MTNLYKILIITPLLFSNISPVTKAFNHLPYNPSKPFKIISAKVYAYNAESNQTDNTPTITASGYNINSNKFNVIANNCLSFGTLVNVGFTQYTVLDRMNKRYNCNTFDILMPTKSEALRWGIKKLTIEVYDFKTNK